MYNRGIRLPFTLLGIPVRVDWSFLIVLPLLAWIIGSQVRQFSELLGVPEDQAAVLTEGATPYVLGVLAAIGLFAGVVVHELGHAVTARAYGVRVRSISLWFLGGIAHFEEMPRRRGAEAVVAIVGPVVSLALAALCWLGLQAAPREWVGARFILSYLTYMNVVLAVFNLIPALPLDGGRVLRSLLALRLPFQRATQIASRVSKVAALLIGLLGLLSFNFFLLLIAFFIFFAVRAEAGAVQMEELLRDVPVRRLMNPAVSTIAPEARVSELADLVWQERHTTFPVVDDHGRVLGIIGVEQAHRVYPATPVGEVMLSGVPTLREDADAAEALRAILRDGRFRSAVVTDEQGRLSGIVTKTDLIRALQLRSSGLDAVCCADPVDGAAPRVPPLPATAGTGG